MPNYFKPNWIEDWKTERQKGKVRYVLIYGLSIAVFCALLDVFVNKRNIFEMETSSAIINAAIFLVGGFIYAIASWFYNENKLKKEG